MDGWKLAGKKEHVAGEGLAREVDPDANRRAGFSPPGVWSGEMTDGGEPALRVFCPDRRMRFSWFLI
jgi:hypothetical protein